MKLKLAQMDEKSFLLLSFILGYLIDPIFCIRRYPSTEKKQPFYKTPKWKKICKVTKKRDDNKCQHCGAKEGLHVHHKTDRTFFNPPLSHLITLCASCHRIEHARINKVNEERKLTVCKIIILVYAIGAITITTFVYA